MVIGAGPAGCMAARTLTRAGFKVLLLEKERIPRDKACGGFLPPGAVRMVEESFGPIPADCLAQDPEMLGARLLCEGGGEYELPFPSPGLAVDRRRFDAFLAEECGAELRDGREVEEFTALRFNVHLVAVGEEGREELSSTYLVAADGADSLSLRLLRPEFHRLYAVPALGYGMLVSGEGDLDWDPRWMGLALLRRGSGLARFFRRGDLVVLAVNIMPGREWKVELDRLMVFLRERVGLRMEGEMVRRTAASNRMGSAGHYNLGAGCALLAGEAAGLLDPWGFGIRLALESGRVAAESLVESAGERITPHVRYRYRMRGILEREAGQRKKLGGLVGELDTSSLSSGKNARRDFNGVRSSIFGHDRTQRLSLASRLHRRSKM